MRAIHFLLLLFSFSAFAADDFETEKKKLEEQFRERAYKLRTETDFDSNNPNDKYIEASRKLHEEFSEKEKIIVEKFCKDEPQGHCSKVLPEQFKKVEATYRGSFGLVSRQNVWIKEGLSKEARSEKTKHYKSCISKKENCDKLSEADLKVTTEEGEPMNGSTTAVVVATEASVPTVKPAVEKEGTAEKPAEVVAAVEVKPEDAKAADSAASKKCLAERIAAIPKLEGDKDILFKMIEESHVQFWDNISEPKKCATLIEVDQQRAWDMANPETPATEAVKPGVVVDDEKDPRNYNASTCKWVTDLPRKIVNGPSCGKTRSRICTGYVVCEQKQGGAKFVRMSSCAADKCGSSDSDAVRCTKDRGYFSEKPVSETKHLVTPKLKEVLSGSSRQ